MPTHYAYRYLNYTKICKDGFTKSTRSSNPEPRSDKQVEMAFGGDPADPPSQSQQLSDNVVGDWRPYTSCNSILSSFFTWRFPWASLTFPGNIGWKLQTLERNIPRITASFLKPNSTLSKYYAYLCSNKYYVNLNKRRTFENNSALITFL